MLVITSTGSRKVNAQLQQDPEVQEVPPILIPLTAHYRVSCYCLATNSLWVSIINMLLPPVEYSLKVQKQQGTSVELDHNVLQLSALRLTW